MSSLNLKALQVGQSLSAANNFTLYQPNTPDGTIRLGRGNIGAVTDLLTVSNTGNVTIGSSTSNVNLNVTGSIDISGSAAPLLRLIENTTTGNAKIQLLDYSNAGAPSEGLEIMYESSTGHSYITNIYSSGSLIIKTSNTERMRIDSAGRMTRPNQTLFQAHGTLTPQTAAGLVQLNTTTVNVGSNFNTSTYTFTAPVSGNYMFTAYGIMGPDGTGSALVAIRKNGTIIARMHRNTSGVTSFPWEQGGMSVVVNMAGGDYVDLYLNNGTLYLADYYSGLWGTLIS